MYDPEDTLLNYIKDEINYDLLMSILNEYPCPPECNCQCCNKNNSLLINYNHICERYPEASNLLKQNASLIEKNNAGSIYLLQNKEPCVFYDQNKCQISETQPITCQLYPFILTNGEISIPYGETAEDGTINIIPTKLDLKKMGIDIKLPEYVAMVALCPLGEQILLDLYSTKIVKSVVKLKVEGLSYNERHAMLKKINLGMSMAFSCPLKECFYNEDENTLNLFGLTLENLTDLYKYLKATPSTSRLKLRTQCRDFLLSLPDPPRSPIDPDRRN